MEEQHRYHHHSGLYGEETLLLKQTLPMNDAVEKPLPNERLDGQLYMCLMGLGLQGKRDEEKKEKRNRNNIDNSIIPPI